MWMYGVIVSILNSLIKSWFDVSLPNNEFCAVLVISDDIIDLVTAGNIETDIKENTEIVGLISYVSQPNVGIFYVWQDAKYQCH